MDILFPTADDITDVMRRVRATRIGVLGDFCVDAYWEIDSSVEEISIETGKRVQHVRRQRYGPGGAGNVVVNLRALGVQNIRLFGIAGDDLFGRELTRLLASLGTNVHALLVQDSQWDTPVYGKPLLDGCEQQRLDFGAFNHLNADTWLTLTSRLCEARNELDLLIVNQQLPRGWCDDARAAWVAQELRDHWRGRHLVDARQFVRAFTGAALKLNQHEADRLLNPAGCSDRSGPGSDRLFSDDDALDMATRLTQISDEAQFITRGERGIMVCHAGKAVEIPGIAVMGPTDTVGAGDTATAMLAACLAAGIQPVQAAVFANMAASITVQKLNQTGTATESELIAAAGKLAYVYHPTLAEEPRRAVHMRDSDIEIVERTGDPDTPDRFPKVPIRFAVFDHDGTISTLRQGWERVMEPVMVHAILGDQYHSTNIILFQRVQQRVRQYIEQSTGIQTIAQMDSLVCMVQEFGIVPPERQLDAWGYKQVYNTALMDMVDDRLRRLARGELAASDFIMKGAVDFLRALRDAGIALYLVSGTDEADMMREAGVLGYADLFNGGIFGAKPGSRADTKDEIIKSLLESVTAGAQGQVDHARTGLLVIGDGPVEIRLGRRYGGTSLGVASNEERRFGLNLTKRRRLIRAGANLITPDFTQWRQLVYLFRFTG